MSIIEVLVASSLAAGVAVLIGQVAKQSTQGNIRVQSEATISNLRNVVATINNDPATWLSTLKDNNSTMKNCLVKTGPYTACPADEGAGNDPVLLAEISGKVISSVDLYDLNSIAFAGKSGSEIYFDASGLPCTSSTPSTDTNCRYKSTGYIVRTAAMTGPISFIRKIEQTAQTITKESPKMQPIYEKVNVGMLWKNPASNSPAVGSIMAYAGDPNDGGIPAGYIAADGSQISIATHPQLYAALGTTWGSGSGTFGLPNLNGRFVRGVGSNTLGTLQDSTYQKHAHTVNFSALGTLLASNVTFQVAEQSLTMAAPLSGLAGYFNANGVYDGHSGWGTKNGITLSTPAYPGTIGSVSGTPTATLNNVNNFKITPAITNNAGLETRPSNAAVVYIIKDDE